MFRSRPATSTHNRNVVLGHEFIQVVRKRFGLERIDCLSIHIERQPRVGDARNGERGIFAEDADGLAHVLGARGAVETDDVDAHAFEDGERGVDVGAEQHATRRIERDLRLDRQIDLSLVEGFVDARDRSFDFEDVLRGFDEQHIHAAADQTDSLFAESLGKIVEADVGKVGIIGGGQFARRSDGTRDETRLTCFLGIFICKATRKARGGFVDLDHTVLQFVFRHRDAVGTEGVRFEHIHADLEERAMDFFHGFGIRDDEVVVASVVLLAAEMFGGEVLHLQAGSHRAVEDEDFLFEGVEITAVCVFAFGH